METVEFVQNEIPKIPIPYQLVIVNNSASIEDSRKLASLCNAELVDHLQAIDKNNNRFLISEEENLGYAKGNNVGAKFLNDNFSIDYLLFSNNDIKLIEPIAVNKLIKFLEENDEIALTGPMIKTPDGGLNHGHVKDVSIFRRIAWNFLFYLKKKKKPNAYQEIPSTPYECNWVSGCFFLIKNDSFKEVEGFDGGTFLYGEEIILSERLRRSGKKTYFFPEASVLHLHSQTIGKIFNEYKQQELQMISHSYFYKNYKNTPQIILWLYRLSFLFRYWLNVKG